MGEGSSEPSFGTNHPVRGLRPDTAAACGTDPSRASASEPWPNSSTRLTAEHGASWLTSRVSGPVHAPGPYGRLGRVRIAEGPWVVSGQLFTTTSQLTLAAPVIDLRYLAPVVTCRPSHQMEPGYMVISPTSTLASAGTQGRRARRGALHPCLCPDSPVLPGGRMPPRAVYRPVLRATLRIRCRPTRSASSDPFTRTPPPRSAYVLPPQGGRRLKSVPYSARRVRSLGSVGPHR
jgi:hypothetical protein